MHQVNNSDPSALWEHISPHLDSALGDLRESDRTVLLLRYFEQKTAKEMAQRLGSTEEAMQKRVTRALESLRKILLRRGVTVCATTLAASLTANALQAAPASLLSGVTTSVLANASLAAPATSATFLKSIGTLAMTKSQIAVTLGLLVSLGIPFTAQQAEISKLHASVENSPAPPPPTLPHLDNPSGLAQQNEAQELERLRKLAADLRAQLAAKRSKLSSQPQASLVPSPILLEPGKPVSIYDLVAAGNATPEAALQSIFASTREGDLDSFLALTLFPPSKAEEINNAFATEENRHAFAEQLQKGLLGVVISEKVERREDNSVSDPVVQEVWPENPSGEIKVEILQKEDLDPKRVRISTRIIRGSDSKTETYTFGRTSSGWKQIQL
jgi:hypothetical protein